jgi:sugar/nucleoside kinase (ribokinase family)
MIREEGRPMALDVYCYGMTVLSTIHRVVGDPLGGDGYAEIVESYVCPGGEGMNGALLLSGLGLVTAIGGPHFGSETHEVLRTYAERHRIDVSGVKVVSDDAGWRDLVILNGDQRTVLGWFGRYSSQPPPRWSEPDPDRIQRARAVAIDPFFGQSSELAAQLARRFGKPYVTIDCDYDGPLHGHSAATVVSREHRRRRYPELDEAECLARYTARGAGLTIFTAGRHSIRYARQGGATGSFMPYSVSTRSTLGAGDAFRAGIVFALLHGLDDDGAVRFAAGLAALVCTRLPIADNVPTLAEVEAFLEAKTGAAAAPE